MKWLQVVCVLSGTAVAAGCVDSAAAPGESIESECEARVYTVGRWFQTDPLGSDNACQASGENAGSGGCDAVATHDARITLHGGSGEARLGELMASTERDTRVTSSYHEVFIVDPPNPAMAGQEGVLVVRFDLTLVGDSSSASGVVYGDAEVASGVCGDPHGGGTNFVVSADAVQWPFRFGEPSNVAVWLTASDSNANASANLRFVGVDEIRDGTGSPVAGATVRSEGGTL